MHYQFSEDAFNRLESTRNQLRFVAGLGSSQPFMGDVADMMSFMDAQQLAVTAALDEATWHRDSVPAQALHVISPEFVVQLIEALSGQTGPEDLLRLYEAQAREKGDGRVFGAFVTALVRQGYELASMKRANSASVALAPECKAPHAHVSRRKRDRLTAGAV